MDWDALRVRVVGLTVEQVLGKERTPGCHLELPGIRRYRFLRRGDFRRWVGVQLWPLLFQDAIRDPGCQEGSWSDGV